MRIKLLFDQNLSYKLCKRLEDLFPESNHTCILNLAQANDDEIWEHAKKNGYTIVTKDSDFNDISMVKGFPPHIIWLRIGNSRLNATEQALRENCKSIEVIIKENKCGVIEID